MLTLDSLDIQNVSNTSWFLRSLRKNNHILNREQFGFIWLSGFIAFPLTRQSGQVSWGHFSPELTCLRHPFGDVIPKSISLGTHPCETHLVKAPPPWKMGDNFFMPEKKHDLAVATIDQRVTLPQSRWSLWLVRRRGVARHWPTRLRNATRPAGKGKDMERYKIIKEDAIKT